jgi:hypothetical protein
MTPCSLAGRRSLSDFVSTADTGRFLSISRELYLGFADDHARAVRESRSPAATNVPWMLFGGAFGMIRSYIVRSLLLWRRT